LALATTLALRANGLPLPAGLVLLSPWTDLASTGQSLVGRIDKAFERRIRQSAADHDVTDPLLSPLYADFSDFSPMVVHAGGHERLLDDSTRLVERASAAGCDATAEVWPGMGHVFQMAAGHGPEADGSIAALRAWLADRLAG
jgi:acetyl esterase/lipase